MASLNANSGFLNGCFTKSSLTTLTISVSLSVLSTFFEGFTGDETELSLVDSFEFVSFLADSAAACLAFILALVKIKKY